MVAKNMYVETNSGWVSDRSICYLASGGRWSLRTPGSQTCFRPVKGCRPLLTLEQAVDAVRAVRREPASHQRAARRLAEEYFDSSAVLARCAEARIGLKMGALSLPARWQTSPAMAARRGRACRGRSVSSGWAMTCILSSRLRHPPASTTAAHRVAVEDSMNFAYFRSVTERFETRRCAHRRGRGNDRERRGTNWLKSRRRLTCS